MAVMETMTEQVAAHYAKDVGRKLAKPEFVRNGSYFEMVTELVFKADDEDLERLRTIYPTTVEAVGVWRAGEKDRVIARMTYELAEIDAAAEFAEGQS